MKKFFAAAFLALLVSPLLALKSGSYSPRSHSSGSHSSGSHSSRGYSSGGHSSRSHSSGSHSSRSYSSGRYSSRSHSSGSHSSRSYSSRSYSSRSHSSGSHSSRSYSSGGHSSRSHSSGSYSSRSYSPRSYSSGKRNQQKAGSGRSSATSRARYRSTIPGDHAGRRSTGHSFSHRRLYGQHSKNLRKAEGWIARSEAAKRKFLRQTGYPHGRRGYVVDHIVPLACGGADAPSNMQWQTIEEGHRKDAVERRGCRGFHMSRR